MLWQAGSFSRARHYETGCPSSEILANLDGAIAAASERGAEEFLVALR